MLNNGECGVMKKKELKEDIVMLEKKIQSLARFHHTMFDRIIELEREVTTITRFHNLAISRISNNGR